MSIFMVLLLLWLVIFLESNSITKTQFEELLSEYGFSQEKASQLSKDVEQVLLLSFGDKYVHVLSFSRGYSKKNYADIFKQFDDIGVSVVLLPSDVKLKSKAVLKARDFKQGFMDYIYKMRALLRENKNGN